MANTPTEQLAASALEEIIDLYQQTNVDDDHIEKPLSGADLVDEIGLWMERNHKILRKLGIIDDPSSEG